MIYLLIVVWFATLMALRPKIEMQDAMVPFGMTPITKKIRTGLLTSRTVVYSWRCPRCGRTVPEDVYGCNCGRDR